MKKLFTFILVFVAALFFVACGHTHEFGEWVVVKEATEAEEGLKERTCECGEKESQKIDKLAHTHAFGEWVVVKEATTEEEGLKERSCACGEKETEKIEKLEEVAPADKTIAEIVAAEDGTYTTTGVVVGTNAQSFLIKDETGIMLVYKGSAWEKDVEVGDKVKVSGETSSYGLAKQFGKEATYEKVETVTVEYGQAKELTVAEMESYASAETIKPEYVKVVGTLAVSGKYFNLAIEGTEAVVGSLTYPADQEAVKALDGKKVEVLGYVTGFTGGKYFNILFTEVKEVIEEVPANKYTVTFKDKDGNVLSTVEVEEGQTVAKPTDPVNGDLLFLGWYNGEVEYDFSAPVTSNLELVAEFFEIKEYTVKFIVDGEVVYEEVVEEGSDATCPSAPYKDGFEFSHWEGNYTNVSADCEIVAVFNAIKFTILFVVDGEVYSDAEVDWGQDATAPENPSKDGYKFVGWDKEFTAVKEDLEVNAVFEIQEYKIRYFNGSEEITTLEPKTYTINDTVVLPSYQLGKYAFMGWYSNSDYTGEPVEQIEAGSTGIKMLYAFNAEADLNGGVDTWTTDVPEGFNAAGGIDSISNLPEMFEMDFYNYLKSKNLLTSTKIDSTCQATTWAKFSGLNPIHNGDPKRIWNDTSTNVGGAANGYVSVYLFGTITLNADKTVKDVQGGFLGTEPYKTKYWGLLHTLVLLQHYKSVNGNYTEIDVNTDKTRALTGFILDGYFYGTQGASEGFFAQLRNTIPGMNYIYKLNGESIVKEAYAPVGLPTPVKDGYAFDGWYLDAECTQAIGSVKHEATCKVYAKWIELQ